MPGAVSLTYAAFLDCVRNHQLWSAHDRLLVGISGGPDSVALAHLAYQTGQLAGLVHVNYHLRGEDADQDEALVHQLGAEWQTPVLIHHTSREALAAFSGYSLQMAAREIRYTWWASLLAENLGTRILTGHQADDQVETILINWIRGTGVAGWAGIPIHRNAICRPLLPFSREQILTYLRDHRLPFRQDRSNDQDVYLRNQIRHHVLPVLTAIQPALPDITWQQTQDTRMALAAADSAVDDLAREVLSIEDSVWTVRLADLKPVSWASYALYRWLHPKGFNRTQIQSILGLKTLAHGQHYHTFDWEATVDRGVLICRPKTGNQIGGVLAEIWSLDMKIRCHYGNLRLSPTSEFITSDAEQRNRIVMNADHLIFPLTIRKWQPGDSMRPFGLKGRKKIKDILINAKSDSFEKQRTLVLVNGSDQEILWLIGHRISESVQPDQSTKNMVILQWEPDHQGI